MKAAKEVETERKNVGNKSEKKRRKNKGKLCMRWELAMFENFRELCVYHRMFVISDVMKWYEMQNQYISNIFFYRIHMQFYTQPKKYKHIYTHPENRLFE